MPEDTAAYAAADLPPVALPPSSIYVAPATGLRPTQTPRLPGSKYYTLRYLLDALLADGESVVSNPALSDDTASLVRCLRALGATAVWEAEGDSPEAGWRLRVRGVAGHLRAPLGGVLHVGNAGAVLRLLLGIGALLTEVRFETDHPASLGRRPNADLLDALRLLGVDAIAREPGGLLPITLRGGAIRGGATRVSGARSSQYLSALLYLGPLLPEGLEITVTGGLKSQPLVRTTLRALADAGIVVNAAPDLLSYFIPGAQTFAARDYQTPGDTPSAAALLAAAVALGVPLRLTNLSWGDDDLRALLAACETLGLALTSRPSAADPTAPLILDGASTPAPAADVRSINGDTLIDSVPALVALACFLPGETRFQQVATLRLKESDRIEDLCAELRRAGADVTPLPDAIIVRGRPESVAGGVTAHAHDDHRLAQALAIVALRSEHGLTIANADAVSKSYPWFFGDLARLGADVRVSGE